MNILRKVSPEYEVYFATFSIFVIILCWRNMGLSWWRTHLLRWIIRCNWQRNSICILPRYSISIHSTFQKNLIFGHLWSKMGSLWGWILYLKSTTMILSSYLLKDISQTFEKGCYKTFIVNLLQSYGLSNLEVKNY